MAEYIDIEKLIPDRCYYEPYGYEAVSCEQIFHEDTADVVERSEYDKMVKSFKARIENQKDNLISTRDAYYQIEKENAELRYKIDKAIKIAEDYISASFKLGLNERAFDMREILEIFVRTVGNNKNENIK